MKDRIVWLMIMVMCLAAAAAQAQGYGVPAGGWFYIQEFDSDIKAQSPAWIEDNSDWDGTAPGTGTPGGVAYLTEGATTYIRIQDAGRPGQNGYSGDDNDKMCFWLELEDAGLTALQGETLLDDGMTFSFRARIATTGILDDRHYHDASPPSGHTAIEPWLTPPMENGEGHQIHNSGNGMFSVHQTLPVHSSDDDGYHIGFSLVTDPDTDRSYWTNDGLTMNSLNGTSATGDVDSNEGTRNVTSDDIDGSEWHEWWITIEADGVIGTHIVTVYMDGGTTPVGTFNVTGGWNDTSGEKGAFIRIGSSNSDEAAAWDTDFMAVGLGVIPPVPPDPNYNPPPYADAGPDQVGYLIDTFQLDGTGSADFGSADGTTSQPGIYTNFWQQRSGPGTATFTPADGLDDLEPTVTFDTKGIYELMLQVYDDQGKDSNDIVVITVKARADEFIVGHWEMEDDLTDSTASANHGEPMPLSGTPEIAYVAGAVGTSALHLDNPDNGDPNGYVHLGPAPELDFQPDLLGVSSFTASAWVKTTNTNTQLIIQKGGDGGGGIRWMLRTSGGNASILTDDDDNKETADGQNVADGLWHHVLGTCNNDGIKIYVDGVFGGEDVRNFQPYSLAGTSQRPGYIGAGTDASGTEPNDVNNKIFDGFIDDVRVYNYVLPFTDPTYDSILGLTAQGPIVTKVVVSTADISFRWKPTSPAISVAGTETDPGINPGLNTIMWVTEAGPASANFTTPTALTSDVTFTTPGLYTLALTVYDPHAVTAANPGGIIWDSVEVEVIAPDCSDVIADDLLLLYDMDSDCYVRLSDLVILFMGVDDGYLNCNDPLDPACPWPF